MADSALDLAESATVFNGREAIVATTRVRSVVCVLLPAHEWVKRTLSKEAPTTRAPSI